MNNYAMLILLKRNEQKKKLYKMNSVLDNIKNEESLKLKNPKKGQIFVHVNEINEYLFFQYDGKKWSQIEE
tara:strand:+ start:847 stop:1059 length:213 start_codon:yes stop_codon:yes gene_type:complete